MRRTSRIAVYLCLLLIVNELGPAHFNNIGTHDHLKSVSKRESEKDDRDNDVGGEKRGIVGNVVKFLTFSIEFLEKTASVASIFVTIYNLVTQCCDGPYANTCVWTNESETIRKELETKAKKINEISLEIKNLEAAVLVASDDFGNTVNEMHRVGEATSRLLSSMDPNVTVALKLTTNKLEKLLKDANATGEKVKFVKLETTYFNVLDGVLGIAVPLFTSLIPTVPKIVLWGKERMGRYKSYELDHSLDGKAIEAPLRSSSRYQASQSFFGKQRAKLAFKIENIKFKLEQKYGKALNVAKGVQTGFASVLSLAKTAFAIYTIVKEFEKCETAYNKSEEGVKTMREAKKNMDEVYDGVVESRESMREARDNLYADLNSEVFLNDLRELKETLATLTKDGTDQEFQTIVDSIDDYINNIQNKDPGFVEVARMIAELYSAMGMVTTYIDCYTAKTAVVRKVLDDCREGDGTLQEINKGAQLFFENNRETCQAKIGMSPFSDETLQTMIDEQSVKMNFNKLCEANNKFKELRACEKYCEGDDENSLPGSLGVSEEAIAIFLERCTKCEFNPNQKSTVCALRELANQSPEEIQKMDLFKRFTVVQIANLDCSGSKDWAKRKKLSPKKRKQ